MKYLSVILLITAFSIAATAQVSPGMPAPELRVGSWVKGTPVTRFEKGQVYVVEFWATWCGPCKGMIPELTQLAKKYEGRVTVIGVSIGERNTALVKPFVDQMGSEMDYHVAIDSQQSPTAKTGFMIQNWLWAGGMAGIPAAYVIGKTGKVEYLGGSNGLEGVLEKVLSGKWDAAAYAATVPQFKTDGELFILKKSLRPALKAGNKDGYYKTLESGLQRCAERNSWEAVNQFLWNQLAESGNKQELPEPMRDYGFAIHWMLQATAKNPAEPGYLDTLAWLYFRSGNKQQAIETEQKAIALAPADDRNKGAFEKALQTFKQ